MAIKNPSQKGFPFENEICRQLSMWWSDGERNDIFCRTRASGAFATMRIKSNKSTPYAGGDITFEDPIGQALTDTFIFSVKRGYNDKVSLLSFVDKEIKNTPTLFKWWEQVEQQKSQHKKHAAALVFRRDYCMSVLALGTPTMVSIQIYLGNYPYSQVMLEQGWDNSIILVNFKRFLEWADPATIKMWCLKHQEEKAWK
jgi:hypothetical protein